MTELHDGPLGTHTRDDLVIDAQNLRIWYGSDRGAVKAVDGVSFTLRKGEILGLVGESGCGKSTLGRGLLGLLPEGAKMDGHLRFKDEDLLALPKKQMFAKRGTELGMIFQEPLTRLNPLMRISQHFEETGSNLAEALLADWNAALARFTEVMPRDYRVVMEAKAKAEADGLDEAEVAKRMMESLHG